jgi:hypothetical protein
MTMTSARPARARSEKTGVLHETWEIVKTIVIALLVALVLRGVPVPALHHPSPAWSRRCWRATTSS